MGAGCGTEDAPSFRVSHSARRDLRATDPRVSLLALWPTKLPDDVKTASRGKICRLPHLDEIQGSCHGERHCRCDLVGRTDTGGD
jgi:hypothetical protein